MPLTTKVYKSFLVMVFNRYDGTDTQVRPVQYPLMSPGYGLANGQYVAYLQNVAGTNIGTRVTFVADHLDINTVTKKITMIISPTTFTWLSLSGASVAKIVIKQILPTSLTEIDCAVIDFGGSYVVDKDLILDFTNSGFISFDSSNYI